MHHESPLDRQDRVWRVAVERLNRQGNRIGLIICFLACIVATVAISMLIACVATVADFLGGADAATGNLILLLLQWALLFFLVFPLYVGLFVVATDVRWGEPPSLARLFVFYGSFSRIRRAWGIQLWVLLFSLPSWGGLLLFSLSPFLPEDRRLLLSVIFGGVGALLLLLGVVTSNVIFPFAVLALQEPDMPLLGAVRLSLAMTVGERGALFGLRMRMLWRMLLSLLSIGVVTLIHVLPLALMVYSEYSAVMIQQSDLLEFEE